MQGHCFIRVKCLCKSWLQILIQIKKSIRKPFREVNQSYKISPGHGFTVDKASVCPLHDLKTQVRSIHTNTQKLEEKETHGERGSDWHKGQATNTSKKERPFLLKLQCCASF